MKLPAHKDGSILRSAAGSTAPATISESSNLPENETLATDNLVLAVCRGLRGRQLLYAHPALMVASARV